MSRRQPLTFALTRIVRDTCLCLHLQRAARLVARSFDDAFRLLGIDRTTATAYLRRLESRGLVTVGASAADGRSRVVALTAAGRGLLRAAVPRWRRAHAALERVLPFDPDRLRSELGDLARAR